MPKSTQAADHKSLLNSSPLGKFAGDQYTGHHDENETDARFTGSDCGAQETPLGTTKDSRMHDNSLITPPNSGGSSSRPGTQFFGNLQPAASSFAFSFEPRSSLGAGSKPSEWESRARSASPAATLAKHAAEGRDSKKSRFLERIRQRRDDSRSEVYGDQVLRMDFVRERRRWEDEMRQRAMVEEAGDVSDEGDADMEEAEQEGLSPTELHDLDELVNDYNGNADDHLQLALDDHGEFLDLDDDEQEYEALFRELVSQGQDEARNRPKEGDSGHWTAPESGSQRGELEQYDSSMDLS